MAVKIILKDSQVQGTWAKWNRIPQLADIGIRMGNPDTGYTQKPNQETPGTSDNRDAGFGWVKAVFTSPQGKKKTGAKEAEVRLISSGSRVK